jgi:hypothetical protein
MLSGFATPSSVNGLIFLLSKLQQDENFPLNSQVAYLLATAEMVTKSGFVPVVEYGPMSKFADYEYCFGNVMTGEGYKFRHRGFAPLTGKTQYADFGNVLGLDLLGNPDVLSDPGIAYSAMSEGAAQGTYTGHTLYEYIKGEEMDFEGARNVFEFPPNPDTAKAIAEAAVKILAILEA